VGRTTNDLLDGRAVSTGSVFSTILISTVIHRSAPSARVGRLVDVGSGDSPYRRVIAHDSYVGLDRRPVGQDALLVTADAAALPLSDGVADGVLCTEVIEHVPDEHALARELARIARPGAPLLLSAPFVHGLHEQPYDYRRLTSIGLVTTLERAGWQIDSVSAIGGPVVVAVDGLVRWLDATWRRAVRRLAPKGSRPFEVLTAPSGRLQRLLAAAALSRGRNLGPIDAMAPSPRLTLGYVVSATRGPGAQS
jgi:SAM-dependent methyltransferase